MARQPRPVTLAELFKRMEGARIELRIQQSKYAANEPIYQDGFIPDYVTNAENYLKRATADYEAALAESEKSK